MLPRAKIARKADQERAEITEALTLVDALSWSNTKSQEVCFAVRRIRRRRSRAPSAARGLARADRKRAVLIFPACGPTL